MPYSVKGFSETNEDMVQILLIAEVIFTQDSKVEDLFSGNSSGPEPSLSFSNYFFSLSRSWVIPYMLYYYYKKMCMG